MTTRVGALVQKLAVAVQKLPEREWLQSRSGNLLANTAELSSKTSPDCRRCLDRDLPECPMDEKLVCMTSTARRRP